MPNSGHSVGATHPGPSSPALSRDGDLFGMINRLRDMQPPQSTSAFYDKPPVDGVPASVDPERTPRQEPLPLKKVSPPRSRPPTGSRVETVLNGPSPARDLQRDLFALQTQLRDRSDDSTDQPLAGHLGQQLQSIHAKLGDVASRLQRGHEPGSSDAQSDEQPTIADKLDYMLSLCVIVRRPFRGGADRERILQVQHPLGKPTQGLDRGRTHPASAKLASGGASSGTDAQRRESGLYETVAESLLGRSSPTLERAGRTGRSRTGRGRARRRPPRRRVPTDRGPPRHDPGPYGRPARARAGAEGQGIGEGQELERRAVGTRACPFSGTWGAVQPDGFGCEEHPRHRGRRGVVEAEGAGQLGESGVGPDAVRFSRTRTGACHCQSPRHRSPVRSRRAETMLATSPKKGLGRPADSKAVARRGRQTTSSVRRGRRRRRRCGSREG